MSDKLAYLVAMPVAVGAVALLVRGFQEMRDLTLYGVHVRPARHTNLDSFEPEAARASTATQCAAGIVLPVSCPNLAAPSHGVAPLGLATRFKPLHSPETVERARKYWMQGHSTKTIADSMGLKVTQVAGIARSNDFPKRRAPVRQSA